MARIPMMFTRKRGAVGRTVAAAVVIVFVVAAVGAFVILRTSPQQTTPTSSTGTPTSTRSSSTRPSASTISTTSSSTESNSTTTRSSSSVPQGYPFKVTTNPTVALFTPGGNESYVTVQVAPSGSLITGSEVVSLNGTAPPGFTLKMGANSATIGNFPAATVSLTLMVSNSTAPGNYSVQFQGRSGGFSETGSLQVQVVEYLVYMENYTFVPQVITVHPDSTVYWMNLDGPHLLCNAYDPGYHSVVFTTGVAVTTSSTTTSTTTTSAASPTLEQFDFWSYTFSQAGTYWYYSGLQPTRMNGTVIVSTG